MRRGITWRRYVAPPRIDLRAEVDDELRFHIEMLSAELVREGWTEGAARAEAERRFGALEPVRADCLIIDKRRHRRVARADIMSAFVQDFWYSLRSFRRAPAFFAITVMTLALGIGAATTMYSVIDGVLLRPLPYRDAGQLVLLTDGQGENETPNSFPEYQDWRARTTAVFGEIGAWFPASVTLSGDGEPESLRGNRISPNLPAVLGVQPMIGRSFTESENEPAADRVVMISEELWRRRFNADPGVIGRVLQLSGRATTVVGVFPSREAARLPSELSALEPPAFWMPLRLDEKGAPRGLHFMSTLARLRPGMSLEAARPRIAAVTKALRKDGVTTHGIHVSSLSAHLAADVRAPLAMLMAAVAMLLLIACANVANLLLARAAIRQREFSVRAALGAARARIVIQLLIESVVRALAGGVIGVALAYAAMWAMHRWLTVRVPRFSDVAIDGRVLAAAVIISLMTGVLFGIIPALRAAGADLNAGLRDGGRGVFGGAHGDRVRRTLIAAEVALSVMLLVGAGLLLRSFSALTNVPKGFDMRQLTTAAITLPPTRYPDSTRQRAFFRDLVRETEAIPGISGAALASNLPIEGGTNGGVTVEGKVFPPDAGPIAEKRVVSAGYFKVLGASLRAGRFFDSRDVAGATPVVMVNETFARRYFPNEQVVGKRVDFAWGTACCQTIVGVVADLREGPLNDVSPPAIYIPVEQRSADFMFLVVRASLDADVLAATLRARLRRLDPLMPLTQLRTLDEVAAAGISRQRLSATLLSVFAVLALLLAAIGLYSVIGYSVAERTQELGLRTALGATAGQIIRLVLRQGLGAVAIGAVIGIAGSLAGGRLLAAQLFGVPPGDPLTLGVAVLVLGVAATVAAGVPALRAARSDPLDALRAN